MAVKQCPLEQRYVASMVLSGVGDALGYCGGDWEFSRSGRNIHEEVEQLGGVENINVKLPKFPVSDDTVMHLATAEALTDSGPRDMRDALYKKLATHYKLCMEDMVGRAPGTTCMGGVHQLQPHVDQGYYIPFNPTGGGCGAAMRMMCVGLRYPRVDQLDKLIAVSIEAGRMTHHHPVGYLGGLVSALFTALAVRGVPARQWAKVLLTVLERAKDYVTREGRSVKENIAEWDKFVDGWREYMKLRRIEEGDSEPVFPANYGVDERDKVYHQISGDSWPGASGRGASIISYDALLAAGDSWVKLCHHGVFHGGDSDSTGCIAGAWFGALYGLGSVPQNHYKELEYLERLQQSATKLYSLSH